MENTDAKVLIVDDDDSIREIMVEIIGGCGVATVEASGGHQALSLLSNDPSIQLVISDIRMPHGDGVELMKSIFEMKRDPKPKLILITGFADLTKEEAINFGVVRILNKPFDADDLIKIVHEQILKN